MWDPCVNHSHHPSITSRDPLYVAVDAGIKHDASARVAVKWDDNGEKLILVSHRIWKPTPTQPLNLEETIEEDLRALNEHGDVQEILSDPYQMHRSISTLQAAGLPIREFPQTQANCTLMGQTLFDLLTGQNLVLYSSDELRQQALSTVAVENPRGWRIAKEKASKKIDAIVALAMACVSAMAHRGEMGSRSARGFNRSMHVSSERLRADRSPVYIGQSLIDVPCSVIAQQSIDGSIRVLAAFASEGMGLRRHIETVVKPWFVTNARFALNDSRLLLGSFEEVQGQTQWDLVKILENALGGIWDTPLVSDWPARRDAVLDLINKATLGTFRPALQIDSIEARILIEALAGRWSYEKDRREKRTVWYYVANAFSLLVSSIQPAGNDEKITVLSPSDPL
jgi:hypothetical protein